MASSRHGTTIFLALASVIWSLLILNRWLLTDCLHCRGVWELFINYFEFGFVKRAFVGTLLSASGLHRLIDNEYMLAIFIDHASLLTLAILLSIYVLRNGDNMDTAFKAMVFLSPAGIIQSGYITGTLDTFVLLATTANILFVKNRYAFSLLLIIGVLIHELYLFTVPAQILSFYWKTHGFDNLDIKEVIRVSKLPALCLAIAMVLVFFFGRAEMPLHEYRAAMQRSLPNVIHDATLLGGYFEVTSGIGQNMACCAIPYDKIVDHLWFLLLPLFYSTALCILAVRNSGGLWVRLFCASAILFPMLISFFAYDIYRWIGMSANMAILLLLLMSTQRRPNIGKWGYAAILPFTALAPFGSGLMGKPFPIHQAIMDRIGDGAFLPMP